MYYPPQSLQADVYRGRHIDKQWGNLRYSRSHTDCATRRDEATATARVETWSKWWRLGSEEGRNRFAQLEETSSGQCHWTGRGCGARCDQPSDKSSEQSLQLALQVATTLGPMARLGTQFHCLDYTQFPAGIHVRLYKQTILSQQRLWYDL